MRRREFLGAFGAAAATWPLAARAQRLDKVRRVGVLFGLAESDPETDARIAAFRKALQDLGWSDSRNIRIDYRATSDVSRMRAYASELVQLEPDVILAHPTPATAAIKRETSRVPVVFANVSDPIGSGFVASFARPGGNMTGFTNFEASLGGKWIDLLREVAPNITRVALFFNPETAAGGAAGGTYLNSAKVAAERLKVSLIVSPVHDVPGIEATISALAGPANGGLIVNPNVFTTVNRIAIVTTAARYGVPAIYPNRIFAEAGGLLSYGIEVLDTLRRAAAYVDRILKGERPADLPVQAPTKFELVSRP